MPTYDALARFLDDYQHLDRRKQREFLAAKNQLVAALGARRPPPPSLRVKRVQNMPGVWELSWAADGRATFQYGRERISGEPHIIWRRIGSHDIFRNA